MRPSFKPAMASQPLLPGPRSIVLVNQTHRRTLRRRTSEVSPYLARAQPTRPAACQTLLGRAQGSCPLLSQLPLSSPRPAPHLSMLIGHRQRSWRKTADAVLDAHRADSCSTSTWNDVPWCRHHACAAPGHGMSRVSHREARGALYAAAPDGQRWLSGPTAWPFARECEW